MKTCPECHVKNPDFVRKCNGCNYLFVQIADPNGQAVGQRDDIHGFVRVFAGGFQSVYVKFVNVATGNVDYRGLITKMRHVDFDVKKGCYELRYAMGSEWINESELFGAETSKHIASQRLDIIKKGDVLANYLIEIKRGFENIQTVSLRGL